MTLCLGNCCLTAYSFVHGRYSGFISMLKKLTLFLRWRKYNNNKNKNKNNNNNNNNIFLGKPHERKVCHLLREKCAILLISSNKFQQIIGNKNIC